MPLEARRRVLRSLFTITVYGGRGTERAKLTGPGMNPEDTEEEFCEELSA